VPPASADHRPNRRMERVPKGWRNFVPPSIHQATSTELPSDLVGRCIKSRLNIRTTNISLPTIYTVTLAGASNQSLHVHASSITTRPVLMRLDRSLFTAGRATWTCARCKTSQSRLDDLRREFSSYRRPIQVVRPRKAVYWAAAGGALGGSLLFFTEDIKHGWHAAARTGRVVTTLAVCINEYVVSLDIQRLFGMLILPATARH
jgi:hypothetical protein